MRLFWARGLPASTPKAVDHVKDAWRQEIADEIHQHHDAHGRLLGWFQHHAIAGGESGRELPGRHQDGEVPRDDLADNAQGFVIVIGDGVMVEIGQRAFLSADACRKIAVMVCRERDVGEPRLTDRLAIVDGLDGRQQFQILDRCGRRSC